MIQAIADNATVFGNSCHPEKTDFLLLSLMLFAMIHNGLNSHNPNKEHLLHFLIAEDVNCCEPLKCHVLRM